MQLSRRLRPRRRIVWSKSVPAWAHCPGRCLSGLAAQAACTRLKWIAIWRRICKDWAMLRSSSMRAMRCALISLSLRARNRRGCGLWAICLTTSPVRCYFILQREVAARIAAAPGSAHYGRLSVMLQSRYAVERLFDVPPCAFAPPPAVHSAVLRMAPHASRALPQLDWARFAALVRAAFSQRRKILRHTLSVYQKTPDFDALGFDLGRRAQEVPVGEYLKLAQHIEQNAHPNPKP